MDLKICQGVCGLCFSLSALNSKCFQQLLIEKAHLESCTRAKCCTSFCAYRIKILKIISETAIYQDVQVCNQRLKTMGEKNVEKYKKKKGKDK